MDSIDLRAPGTVHCLLLLHNFPYSRKVKIWYSIWFVSMAHHFNFARNTKYIDCKANEITYVTSVSNKNIAFCYISFGCLVFVVAFNFNSAVIVNVILIYGWIIIVWHVYFRWKNHFLWAFCCENGWVKINTFSVSIMEKFVYAFLIDDSGCSKNRWHLA